MAPDELGTLLATWILEINRQDGAMYHRGTIKGIVAAIQRWLRSVRTAVFNQTKHKMPEIDIMKDTECSKFRANLDLRLNEYVRCIWVACMALHLGCCIFCITGASQQCW